MTRQVEVKLRPTTQGAHAHVTVFTRPVGRETWQNAGTLTDTDAPRTGAEL